MATYKEIKGVTVQTRAEDPVQNVGSWSSGANLPANINSGMGFGTQTASVIGGGYNGSTYSNNVYEYDGTSWTSGGSLTASLGQARTGHGILTAGGAVAGYKTSGNAVINNYEQYDGTSFTEQADLNTARQTLAAAGSTTAALAVGGTTGVGPGSTQEGLTNVESYNGSSWTETTENNTARKQATSFSGGPAPTMIYIGGASDSTLYANVETYNGSAWTETTDLNTARSALAGAGQAQTDGLVFGGAAPSVTAATESWNGTTWTELNDLGTARHSLVGSGTGAASALAAGGGTSALTEEFTAPSIFSKITEGQLFFNSTANAFKETVQDFPGGTFASGGSLNTARRQQGTFGAHNDAIVAGTLTYGANVENYNGTTWTEINDVPAGASSSGGSGTTSSSGAVFMGYNTSTSVTNATYEFDGTNWTTGGSANTSRGAGGGTGSSADDAIYVGGTNAAAPQTVYANVETYNGSSWTETTDIATASQLMALVGTSTSALLIGGSPNPTPTQTQSWNGTSWTNIGALPTNIYGNAGFGTSALAIACGGLPPGTDTNANMRAAMLYNGTSWSDVSEMATSRASGNGIGTNASATNGLVFGGYNPTNSPVDTDANKTEEWTVDLANKTITAS